MDKVAPIFIISLPRSGSTLLQRILTSHESVASASEPWLLLPLIEIIGSENIGSCANYSKLTSQLAATDFYSGTEKGIESFYEAVQLFLNHGYESYCNNDELYFIDKTPRYYLIIDEIYKVFPNAKCIFIFRNPLEVMASMIKTWHSGEFKLHHHHIDLYKGINCLYHGYSNHKEKTLALTYDELVNNPASTIQGICSYLGLKPDSEMVEKFSRVNFSGRMGDSVGVKKYFELSGRKNDNWRKVLSSPIRKWYCRMYISYFSDDVWSTFGLTRKSLLEDLEKERMQYRSTVNDLFWIVVSPLYRMISSLIPRGISKKSVFNRDFYD